MRGKPILLLASTLLLIISCDKREPQHSLNVDHNTKQIVFFSDDKALEQEVSYYDAIIELKQEYPEEMKHMKILSASELDEYGNLFKVDHCPALLVYYRNKVIVEIEGKASTADIISSISRVLSSS
ncbi:hypothetical protein [Bacillus tuaregi]|uniref:hypothetical protein n=1 Tax=Bacillus tuaregi TaxID=1816695 RepID=UPI000A002622|nr:hypothetical protein [Bacillus tuaregi]